MPAVSVLPFRRSTNGVDSHDASEDGRFLNVMSNRDEIAEFDTSQPSKVIDDPRKVSPRGNETPTEDGTIYEKKTDSPTQATVSPTQSSTSYPQGFPSHLTPQPLGYYPDYAAYQYQVTPEQPSPSQGGHMVYDINSMMHQPTGFAPFPPSFRGAVVHGPPNPSPRAPPASPLFQRGVRLAPAGQDPNRIHDGSNQRGSYSSAPGGRYLSPVYPTISAYVTVGGTAGSDAGSVGESFVSWGDGHQVTPYPQDSPQLSSLGIQIPYVPCMPPPRSGSFSSRSYSFGDDSMLPPPAEGQSQDQYSFSQNNPGTGVPGTLLNLPPAGATASAWGYGAPPPDMYGASANPLQPRSPMSYGMGAPPRPNGPGGAYGQFFPASSPGPPIQTTASNKGPDGANLFIFHIPNHFTNLDMYQLFCPYGVLLSVRIMVEKDSGRSRGFGFVSYNTPEAAALAIKELNGFTIGNKRLKVQHKQIRDQDLNQGCDVYGSVGIGGVGGDGTPIITTLSSVGEDVTTTMPLGPTPHQAVPNWYGQQASFPEGMGNRMTTTMEGPDLPVPVASVSIEEGTVVGGGHHVGSVEDGVGMGALSGFDPLRQALPDPTTDRVPAT